MSRRYKTRVLGVREVLSLLALLWAAPVTAGEGPVDLNLTLQYRPRLYVNQGHDFQAGGGYTVVMHRARIGAGATYDKKFGVYLEMQDVRRFGDEQNTLGDFTADTFDLHQGFARVMPMDSLEIRVGRQEVGLENHRLIGTVGWTEQARSFDGARVTYTQGRLGVDALYARVAEDYLSTVAEPSDDANTSDVDLAAANLHYYLSEWASVGGLGILDADDASGRKRITLGAIVTGAGSGISYSAEGYYQMGSADGDVSYAAYLAAGHLRYTLQGPLAPFAEVFGEVVSGDDDGTDSDINSFDTLYATNHKFYGEMDFFLDLPKHSEGRGLMDVGAQAGFSPFKRVAAMITGHYFRGMEDVGDGLEVFGTEIDARIDWKPYKKFKVDFVYAIFLPGEILEPAKSSQPEHFAYTTLDVSF